MDDKQTAMPQEETLDQSVQEIAQNEPAIPTPLAVTQTTSTNELSMPPKQGKLKRVLKSQKFWIVLFLSMLAIATATWFIQPSRIYIVNRLGLQVPVKVTTTTIAEPDSPSATLKSVTVTVNGHDVTSNDEGVATTNVPYGVTAAKTGYGAAEHTDFYDFNPFFNIIGAQPKNGGERLVELQLKSVGLALKFKAKNWLTDGSLTIGTFSVGDVVATPDFQGLVALKVPPTDQPNVLVKARFNGSFNDRDFEVTLHDESVQEFTFVPTGKDYFVSKRTGQFVVYSSNFDGSQTTQIVAGSANETAAIDFAVSPTGRYAALASTREGKKDSSGQLLQKLYVVNLSDNQLTALDESRWFDFVDWSGDMLLYTAAATTTTQRLASIDASVNKKIDLGVGASYGTLRVALGNAIYQVNNPVGEPAAANNPELRIHPLGGGTEKNVGNKVEAFAQTAFDSFAYQTSDKAWHQYNVNTGQVSNIAAPSTTARAYLNATSPDGQQRLVVDKIDGKVTLLTENVANGSQKQLYDAAGLKGPIRWVGGNMVFRVVDSTQSADYVMSANGGPPKKVSDVTDTTRSFVESYFGFY